jgi:hypothetical protein
MTLLLAIIFFVFVVGAIYHGYFSFANVMYSFREHPVQFIIVLLIMLGAAILCTYLFLKEINVIK